MPEKDHAFRGKFNPFPGLRPFAPEERDLFFGREGQSEEVLNRLKNKRFVTVIGASGSGKSSLVYCGVIPHFFDAEGKDIKNWQLVGMRPGNDPLANLSSSLASTIKDDKKGGHDKKIIDEELRNNERGLVNSVNMLRPDKDTKVLLIIDQFEELFRYRSSSKRGRSRENTALFVNLLVNAVMDQSSGVSVIISMRSDYIGDCAHYQGLTDLINSSNYLVPHMSEDNYRKVIRGPVKYAGATIEDELLDLLISDIGDRNDRLPVLQHALMRTWEHWQSRDVPESPISVSDYHAVGKMSEAMSKHANEAFAELDDRGREICETLFRTITEKGADNKGTRHPTRLETIAAIARCSIPELISVIDVFRAEGRSFITPAAGVKLDGETVVDITHESLMRLWDRLSEWVEKEAASQRMYLKISESASMFQEGKTSLLRPPELHLAINWRNENMPNLTWAERFNPAFERTMVYLRTSEREYIAEEENKVRAQKRQLYRSRVAAVIMGSAAVISVFLMLYAFVKQFEAEEYRQVADEMRIKATEEQRIAIDNEKEAQQDALEARRQEALALAEANAASIKAMEATREKRIADRLMLEAQKQEEMALAKADTARINAEKALKMRMLSTGKAMAVRSLNLSGQGDIQTLLAYQAYLFNKRYEGADNDADIYMGLYHVAKVYDTFNYNTFKGHEGMVHSVAFIDGTRDFYSAGSDGRVLRWNSADREQRPQPVFEGDEIIEVMASSRDGQMLAYGTEDTRVRIIPSSDISSAFELTGHSDRIQSLAFTPDKKNLVSAGKDGQVILWDIERRQASVLFSEAEAINSVDISGSGRYLVAASDSGLIQLWNLDDNTGIREVNTGNGSIGVVRFKDDNQYAVAYKNGLIEFRSIDSENTTSSLMAHSMKITDICFNRSLNQMASSGADGTVKLWNCDDMTQVPVELDDNNGYVLAMAFSPDGRLLLSASSGKEGDGSIIARPSHVDYMVTDICRLVSRNFTMEEWWRFVGRDIDYEKTCGSDQLKIRIREIRGD
ncbi:MAG: hypothetical protein KFF49_04705 [Bacteroidales bacterium]|nr:hypothetical protein [Bacteroidales bacterium]